MHYATPMAAEPQETLHDLVGAGGDSIHWPRVGLFLAATIAGDLPAFVIEPLLFGGYFPPLFFSGVYLLSDVVITAALLLACRLFRSPWTAALLAPVFYFAGMLPVRILQVMNMPEDYRWELATNFLLYGLLGNFLFFAGVHLFLRWLRPLLLALAVGIAASYVASELVQVAISLARDHFHWMDHLRSLAYSLGSAVLFAGVYWAGTLLPVMQLGARAAAPGLASIAPGASADLVELQRAADFRSVRKRLRTAAFGSMFFGVFAIGLGIYGLKDSPLNALLVLLGLFLLGEGVWLLVQPTPTGMIVDGIALCLVGLWNILVTIANLAAGAGGPTFALALGFIQIGWGIGSFRRYGRFAHLAGGAASAEAIARVDALVAGIAGASMKTSADIIEFTVGAQQWKGRLTPELGVFVVGGIDEEVVLAGKSAVIITPQEPVAGKPFKAEIQLGPHTHKASLSPEAYQRYQSWRSS
ncbi:MAG: hypothetical protein L0212_06940 [Acidobacteria bacterium]|nr:hypothetical protein [Acidobacteriota bacterium]